MKPKIYLETTIPSYLAAPPSRDLVIAAHQQITHEWWKTAKTRFELFTSEFVLNEIRAGRDERAAFRLELLDDCRVLAANEQVNKLVRLYGDKLGLKGRAKVDVPHFAFAVEFEMDYLVTWNCAHIANGIVTRRLAKLNQEMALSVPIILTPEELQEPE